MQWFGLKQIVAYVILSLMIRFNERSIYCEKITLLIVKNYIVDRNI